MSSPVSKSQAINTIERSDNNSSIPQRKPISDDEISTVTSLGLQAIELLEQLRLSKAKVEKYNKEIAALKQ